MADKNEGQDNSAIPWEVAKPIGEYGSKTYETD